jgi:hypothetical protein
VQGCCAVAHLGALSTRSSWELVLARPFVPSLVLGACLGQALNAPVVLVVFCLGVLCWCCIL